VSSSRVVCVVGPTASGKTALTLGLAESLGAEIVSADSRQVYRHMDIGTAKPTRAEQARVHHHCVDLVDPGEPFDVARFRDAATAALRDMHARGRPAFVVGGTGLYVRALLRGLCPAPPRVPAIRAALAAIVGREGTSTLHRHLAVIDPVAAARIHPHDAVRLERALEVALSSGRRLSEWQAAHSFGETPYQTLVIGLALPPVTLGVRIGARARAMVAAGFLDEVRLLRARGLDDGAAAWRAVGYREMRGCVDGQVDLEGALAATVRATRRFARRQRTWFRVEPGIHWRHPDTDRARIVDEVAAFLASGTRPP